MTRDRWRDLRTLRELAELGAVLRDRRDRVIELREVAPGQFAAPKMTAMQRRIMREVDDLAGLAKELRALGDACRKL
jgi:hypothetical protein